jgi:hypothetical protein
MRFNIDGTDYTIKFVHKHEVTPVGHVTDITICQLRQYRHGCLPDFEDHFACVRRYAHDSPDKVIAHKKALAAAMKVAGFSDSFRAKLWNAYFNRRKNPKDYK